MCSRPARLAVAAGLVLALAACGGGTKRLSKAEFISTWDAICKKSNEQNDKVGQDLPDQATQQNLSQFADAFDQGLPIIKDEVTQLRKVSPPEADQTTIDGILSDLDQAITALEEARDAARGGDLAAYTAAVERASPKITAANGAATSYGLKDCGA